MSFYNIDDIFLDLKWVPLRLRTMRASVDHIVLGSIRIQFYIIYIVYAIYQKVKLVVVFAEHFSHLAMIILRVLL